MEALHIIVTDRDGHTHTLEALEGWRVMEIIRDNGLPIKAECGGACACATCHVYVDEEWLAKLPDMRDDEEEMLDEAMEVESNSRLSCQLLMSEALNGLKVTLAPEAA
jgi:ferredoxin, 2Fe-2S